MAANQKSVIKVKNHNNIAVITLNRPQAANAFNSAMARELIEVLTAISTDIRTVVLTGEGDKAFCAGADLKERHNMSSDDWRAQHQLFRAALKSVMDCPIPVIAAVGGVAYGGGFELSLGCDFIYASDNATFALPEVSLGIMPGMGGTQNLLLAAGLRRAKEILFTAKPISADTAYSWGIVNRVFPQENLLEEAIACAQNIAKNAPLSLRAVKAASGHNFQDFLNNGLARESEHYQNLLNSADRMEGITAFNEKRKPEFSGK
ncbi:MAG: enoyl-CoA hydratase-related protein [Rickettsiales bacterium]